MSKRYSCNENYFEIIDTEDKAYWLGFLYADGCVNKDKTNIILHISIKDYEHLLLFRNAIDSDHKIHFTDNNTLCRLDIRSKKMATDLTQLGCTPRKTFTLNFPTEEQVPKKFIRHFIRGYFDGDGCVYNNYSVRKNRKKIFMNTEIFFLGTKELLIGIATELNIEPDKVQKKSGESIYALRIAKKIKIIEIMNYLYNESTYFLQRKYIKFLEIKEYVDKSSYNYQLVS